MNTMMISAQTNTANAAFSSVAGATAAGTAAAGTSAGAAGATASAFASLLLGLLPAGTNESGQNPLVSLALPTASGASALPVVNSDAAAEDDALAELLDQLLQLIEAMPAPLQEQLAAWTPAQQWTDAATVELAIAEGDLTAFLAAGAAGEQQAGSGNESNDAGSAFAALLARLSEALKQGGESPALRQAAAEAKKVVVDFLTAAQTALKAEASPTDALNGQRTGTVDAGLQRTAFDTVRQSAAALLTQMNGKMTTESEKKSTVTVAAAQSSHLAAMESKFASVRLTVVSETGQQAPSEQMTSGGTMTETEGTMFSSVSAEANKAAASEAVQRSNAMTQRMDAEAFAEQMTEWLLKQSVSGKSSPVTEAKIMLMPEHLGQLEVKLSFQNGQLVALFNTESAMAKDMLESNLAVLRTNLQSQGVQVEKLEVSQQSMQGSGLFQDGKQRQGAERDSRQTRQQSADGIEEWADALGLRLEETEGDHVRTYGSSFHATA